MAKSTGGRRPTLTIEPSIRVELSNRRKGDGARMVNDDGSISAFMHWQLEQQIFPFRGGASGPGFYTADFPAEHAAAINAYFTGVGLLSDSPARA